MTHTARYDAISNVLVELPWMGKPIEPIPEKYDGDSRALSQDVHDFVMAKEAYNAHLASLRTIPCHLSCKEIFKDGEVYEEGKDYCLRDDPCPYFDDINDPVEYTTYVYPVVVQVSEDDLWRELFLKLHIKAQSYKSIMGDTHPGLPSHEPWHDEAITELKKHFTITKR